MSFPCVSILFLLFCLFLGGGGLRFYWFREEDQMGVTYANNKKKSDTDRSIFSDDTNVICLCMMKFYNCAPLWHPSLPFCEQSARYFFRVIFRALYNDPQHFLTVLHWSAKIFIHFLWILKNGITTHYIFGKHYGNSLRRFAHNVQSK